LEFFLALGVFAACAFDVCEFFNCKALPARILPASERDDVCAYSQHIDGGHSASFACRFQPPDTGDCNVACYASGCWCCAINEQPEVMLDTRVFAKLLWIGKLFFPHNCLNSQFKVVSGLHWSSKN
jgi:hypothetical protein